MTTLRRWLVRAVRPVAFVGAFIVFASLSPRAAEPVPITPLMRLKAGNERYVKGTSAAVTAGAAARLALAAGERPYAMVLSCADSRVAPEYVFNAGVGDLFVVRTIGEVVDKAVMASLEYGAGHLHIPLLVVMGHDSCAVVKTAVDSASAEGPNLEYAAKAIRAGTTRTPGEQIELRAAILANVEQVINDAMGGSQILRDAAAAGHLQVIGAYHELSTGTVVFSEPVDAITVAAHK